VNAVLGNIIGIFITPAWLSVFLDVAGQAPYTKVRRRATGAQACAGVTCA
jgi:predicted Na+-dependent transporter